MLRAKLKISLSKRFARLICLFFFLYFLKHKINNTAAFNRVATCGTTIANHKVCLQSI